MRVVLTGGGTGGHAIPNLAVIDELKKRGGFEILYVGSENGVEQKMAAKAEINYRSINCGKFRRYFSWQNFVDVLKIPLGVIESHKILKEFAPDVVFSKGGYVSLPVVLAAKKLKIPIIAHESDVSPGLSNKVAFKFASTICLSFEESKKYLSESLLKKVVVTGNPVRKNLLSGNVDSGHKFTGLDRYRPVILVIGGSLGAMQINLLVRAGLDELLKKFQIIHIVGKGNLDIGIHKRGYVQYEYLNDELKDIYAMSEMVVSRGGAGALSELAVLKKKVLIVPLCGGASRGEQVENARIFSRKFGWSMISGNITREDFINNIEMSYNNDWDANADYKNGVDEIVDLITSIK